MEHVNRRRSTSGDTWELFYIISYHSTFVSVPLQSDHKSSELINRRKWHKMRRSHTRYSYLNVFDSKSCCVVYERWGYLRHSNLPCCMCRFQIRVWTSNSNSDYNWFRINYSKSPNWNFVWLLSLVEWLQFNGKLTREYRCFRIKWKMNKNINSKWLLFVMKKVVYFCFLCFLLLITCVDYSQSQTNSEYGPSVFVAIHSSFSSCANLQDLW